MRRSGTVLLACVLAVVTLAGCHSVPANVDGDLTDDWPAIAQAVTPTPDAGACYDKQYAEEWQGEFGPSQVSCTVPHWTETVHVGTFTGDVASRTVPPLTGSSDLATAYQDCAKATTDYLGGDWRTSYAYLGLTLPDKAAWTGGARWYRCELGEVTRDSDEDFVQSSALLKDGLRGSRPLARTCELVQDDSDGTIKSSTGIDCGQPHNAEFAGLYTLTGSSYPAESARDQQAGAACGRVMQSYVGLSSTRSHYFGWLYFTITEDEWNLGIRTGICEVLGFAPNGSINGVRFTGSVHGGGDRKPAGWHT